MPAHAIEREPAPPWVRIVCALPLAAASVVVAVVVVANLPFPGLPTVPPLHVPSVSACTVAAPIPSADVTTTGRNP